MPRGKHDIPFWQTKCGDIHQNLHPAAFIEWCDISYYKIDHL